MANVSKEDDARDFEERKRNNGNRPNVGPRAKTQQELIDESEARYQASLRELRRFREKLERGI